MFLSYLTLKKILCHLKIKYLIISYFFYYDFNFFIENLFNSYLKKYKGEYKHTHHTMGIVMEMILNFHMEMEIKNEYQLLL